MKQIVLFRHGKSDWDDASAPDHARTLAERGRRAARRMGRFLAEAGQAPDLVITSSAARARQSVELAVEAGGWKCPVQVTDDLYETSPDAVLEAIRRVDDAARSLLLAGHEPTWSRLAGALIGGGRLDFPTAAMARIDFEVGGWGGVDFGRGALVWLVRPRLLGKLGLD